MATKYRAAALSILALVLLIQDITLLFGLAMATPEPPQLALFAAAPEDTSRAAPPPFLPFALADASPALSQDAPPSELSDSPADVPPGVPPAYMCSVPIVPDAQLPVLLLGGDMMRLLVTGSLGHSGPDAALPSGVPLAARLGRDARQRSVPRPPGFSPPVMDPPG